MLQVFYLDVCNGFQLFLQMFYMHVSSVSFVLFYMLQVLYVDVLKIDRVLHMGCVCEAGGDASSPRAGDFWVT
jgi:hypothetical protein